MTNAKTNDTLRWWWTIGLMLLAIWPCQAQVDAQPDIRFTGMEIQSFTDDGESVLVVLGDFTLTFGDQTVTALDGVLWLSSETEGQVRYNVLEAYVEGGSAEAGGLARIVYADGREMGDRTMFLSFRTTGQVSAGAFQQAQEDLSDLALYQRARTARLEAHAGETEGDATDETPSLPALVYDPQTGPDESDETDPEPIARVEGGDSAGSRIDNGDVPFVVREVDSEGPGVTAATPDRTPVRPTGDSAGPLPQYDENVPLEALPVHFNADELTSRMIDDRRVTFARGNFYLSQGSPDAGRFNEIQADEAVVFSRTVTEAEAGFRDSYAPASMPLEPGQESIVGVYLRGDVIVSRGEQYMRCNEAYYDFTTDRAIMIQGVFRTIQDQRDIPIVARFEEGRILSAREIMLEDAQVSTSEFYTPTYAVTGNRIYMMDMTVYDDDGERLTPRHWLADVEGATVDLRGTPILYIPRMRSDFRQGHTPLRTASAGFSGQYGVTVETEWYLFRLLGLVKPEGFDAMLHLDYKQGPTIGIEADWERANYTGYARLWGMLDQERSDDFGRENENNPASTARGRALIRHKQFLPRDWQMQFELSYLSDRNYLRNYFPSEYYNGKDQETLVYAQKQRDNWAVDVLLRARINSFLTQTEALPDVGAYMIGEPIFDDLLTFFGEAHVGALRWRPGSLDTADKNAMIAAGQAVPEDSDWMARGDLRGEVNMPLHLGPVNVVPFASGRVSAWSADPGSGDNARVYGMVGTRVSTHLWRNYDGVRNRLLDIDGLRHIMTPEAAFFISADNGVTPADLYPLSPSIEEHITDLSGMMVGIRNRLQTQRGQGANRRTVNWMRFDIMAGFFDGGDDAQPISDSRYFASRPEYSMGGNNFIYMDYAWYMSDSTTFLADMNYDLDNSTIARSSMGIRVDRSPRMTYYAGLRTVDELSSAIGTLSMRYQISRRYAVQLIEQYDFDYRGGTNLRSEISFIRKWPRWYTSLTFGYDARWNDFTIMFNLWPEGIAEANINTGTYSLYRSEEN
jgi:hypothetical protein